MHTVIPNFVDTVRFHPASHAERIAARTRFGLSADAFVLGEVAAVKSHHKRIDRLIQAFAVYCREHDGAPPATLIIAGAKTAESDDLVALAESRAPGKVKFSFNLSRESMPEFYRALDGFVHAALFEMMPIALLEALACGVPVLHHDHPVMNWMTGAGGLAIDMADDHALARTLATLSADQAKLQTMRRAARERAVNEFSTETVVTRILEYYREVVGGREDRGPRKMFE